MLGGEGSEVIEREGNLGIAGQISEGFGLAPPRRMVWAADGAMGRVWRLETESGSFAVKESLRPEDQVSFERQVDFAASVSEQVRRAGVDVPQVVRTRTGSLMLRVEKGQSDEPMCVRVATWIDGRAGVDTSRAAGWLGSTLASVETLADPPTVPPGDPWLEAWFTQVPTPEQWAALVQQGSRLGVEWAPTLTHHLPAFADLRALVVPPRPEQLTVTHTDLQPKNVLTSRDGYALLDWDDVAQVSRDRILARAIADWHVDAGVIDTAAVHRTLAAYGEGGGTGTLRDVDAFGDLIAGFLNYLFEQLTSSLDPTPGGATASAAAGQVARAMLDRPVDMATLHRLTALDQPR